MRILITGNMGYLGSVLVGYLRERYPGAELAGFDTGFFAHCLTAARGLPECLTDLQHFGDLRQFPASLLDGVDTVVHLAAISNDPMGNQFEAVTEQINATATAELARLARRAGVRRFVFASSCSIYGATGGAPRKESDEVNPLTAYARSKVATEQALAGLCDSRFVGTSLRFATACGMSPRLRLDLVFNDFVAAALSAGEIRVLSDGTPWRPLIHVRDMARAIDWAMLRDASCGGEHAVVNAGSETWTFQMADLARRVAALLPGTSLSINTAAAPDRRTYRVDFSRFRQLAPEHQPAISLETAVAELGDGLRAMDFRDREFRNSWLIRLAVLRGLVDAGSLDAELYWTAKARSEAP